MKSVCFTGHRIITITENLNAVLTDELCGLIETEGVTDFYAGGAVGWDTLCAQTVIALRSYYPQIRLHLVLPCCEAEQTAKWSDAQKLSYKKIFNEANSVEYTSQNYFEGCMKKRNARLVELADICVCYYNTKKINCGTGQTVRMALKKNIRVINIYSEEQNSRAAI